MNHSDFAQKPRRLQINQNKNIQEKMLADKKRDKPLHIYVFSIYFYVYCDGLCI